MAAKKEEEPTAPELTTATMAEDIIVTPQPTSVWNTLSRVNVSGHTERKQVGGRTLTYLSWAWAWSEVKKIYPDTSATVYENPEGWPYWTDGKTCWVKVGVTIEGTEHREYFPVMNARHDSIPADKVTSWDVNTAIQRGLTKCIARHGLGMYVYAGEDLPEVEKQVQQQTKEEADQRALEAIADINAVQDGEQYAAVKDLYMDLLVGDRKHPAVIKAAQLKYQQLFNNNQ